MNPNLNLYSYHSQLSAFHKELQRIQKLPKIDSDDELCSRELSNLVKMNLLSYDEILTNPEKFFAFHEAISEYIGLEGFGIRFTVQHNLYAGSIMALGTQFHKEQLIKSQKDGVLGCFMLTEYNSGVLSGMLCNTVAKLLDNNFVLNTLDTKFDFDNDEIDFENTLNRKNWISQGLHSRYGVVIARLIVNSTDHGIHPFLINMNQSGIYKKSNGSKTIANSLDNAMIVFKNVIVPAESLMYPSNGTQNMNDVLDILKCDPSLGFKRIASRLNSGRLCIALSMNKYLTTQFNTLMSNTFSKVVNTSKNPEQKLKLEELPEINYILQNNKRLLNHITLYVNEVVKEYCERVRNGKDFDDKFLENIMITKVLVANYGFKLMNELKVKMGSNSLFAEKGMGTIDILLCARFAEGDNDILLTKLIGDRIKKVSNFTLTSFIKLSFKLFFDINESSSVKEDILILELARYLYNHTKSKSKPDSKNVYEKMKKCKEIMTFNIVNDYMRNVHLYQNKNKNNKNNPCITLSDIKSML